MTFRQTLSKSQIIININATSGGRYSRKRKKKGGDRLSNVYYGTDGEPAAGRTLITAFENRVEPTTRTC